MNNNLILSQIKRATRNLFLINFLLIIVSTGVLINNFGEFINYLHGPSKVEIGSISSLKINGLIPNNYVQVNAEDQASAGLQFIEKEYDKYSKNVTRSTVQKEYYMLRSGNDLVIASISPEKTNLTYYSGWIREMTADERNHLNPIIAKAKETTGLSISNYILDSTKISHAPFLYIIFGTFFLIGIFNFFRCAKYYFTPDDHKIYKKLSQYGDPETIIEEIESELSMRSYNDIKNIYYLKSWILSKKLFNLTIVKIDDIVWCYKKVTKHSVNFIPTNKTYELVLCLNNKSQIHISTNKYNVDNILYSFKQSYPWIINGFSQELSTMWLKQTAKLNEYVQAQKQITLTK